MTTKLNLSTNPFRNRALPWTVTTIITVVSVALLLVIARSTIQTNAQVQSTQQDIANLQKQTSELNKHAEAIKAALTPDQQRTLKSAHLLVDRKRFSWSRLFGDLESVMPGNVRVSRIAVKEVRLENDRPIANLDLVVMSKNPATITEMIQDMERQGVFHAELVSQSLQRGKGESGEEYEMDVRYVPSAGSPADPAKKRIVDTAGEGARNR
jgi:Tfp pilus assembly protein PilN